MRFPCRIFMAALACAAIQCAQAKQEPSVDCSVSAPNVTCVMNHLDNPRGLAFGPQGSLFVTEAGYGAAPCKPGTGFNCYGHTGAVTRLWRGEQVQVTTKLPSLSFVLGASARGAHDIVMWNGDEDSALGGEGALVTIGAEMTATARDAAGRHDLAHLLHIPMDALMAPSSDLCTSCWTSVLDIATFQPPDSLDPNRESDPYGLLVEKGSGQDPDSVLLIDSSRNWLDRIEADGSMTRVASFYSRFGGRYTDAVPTTVARGPDGDFYVGEFVGIPVQNTPAVTRQPANIYRVSADPPHAVTTLLGGFNAIIDIAFHGEDLYVLQHWSSFASSTLKDGKLIRIACHDRPLVCDGAPEVIIGNLDTPTSVLIGRGAIYVSHRGAVAAFASQTAPHTPLGEVLRIALDDDEGEED